MKNSVLIALLFLMAGINFTCESSIPYSDYVEVKEGKFYYKGKFHQYVGTNFWYGAYLGQEGSLGDRERLKKELDVLAEHGIMNLRILGASEESSFRNSLSPAFINGDGNYNENLLIGLDYLLSEMGKRGMHAVIFLNNYWEWSGGMSMYNKWYGDEPVIDPADGDWEAYMKFVAKFYSNETAQIEFQRYISQLIKRTNSITNVSYSKDPTIMSWQLANEPRPGRGEMSPEAIQAYYDWIDGTAGFIKSLAPDQLVSSGSEGKTGSLDSMEIFVKAHNTPNIDYLTFHMWAKNWGWINPKKMEETFSNAQEKATEYILSHIEVASQMNKPIVMEEFGFPRDNEEYSPNSSTSFRDQYYKMVFDLVEDHLVLAGTNFWSWGGFGEAQNQDFWWHEGDPFTGDPPQEPQGLNSVFSGDDSTLEIIRTHAKVVGVLK
ncbi:MAG: glycoside hydrolase 5 family protein [Balneola sp.]